MEQQNNITREFLKTYQENLALSGLMPDEKAENIQRWAYLQAAAVLHCFYAAKLVPAHGDPTEDIRSLLSDDILFAPGRYLEGIYILRPEIRRQALKRFASRNEMLDVLHANTGHPQTSLQVMWAGYLESGQLADPQSLGYGQLNDYAQIITWLNGIDQTLPQIGDIHDLLRKKSILANFEHLVVENFTGRTAELAFLIRHITTAPKKESKSFTTTISDWFSPSDPKPLLSVYGPGGIGKSALAGKLLYENAMSQTTEPFPFVYIPFDLGNMRVESPLTILVEAASQLSIQLPALQQRIEIFNNYVREFRDRRSSLASRSKSLATRSLVVDEYHQEEESLYKTFVTLVNQAVAGLSRLDSNLVIVFDTFEEVEYRDYESLGGFWRLLDILIKNCPRLRFIISGRISIAKLGVNNDLLTERALQEFSQEDRIQLLTRLGVDPTLAPGIAKQVGGNPLTLRLAASLYEKDKTEVDKSGIRKLETKKYYFFQVDDQIIQGQLYRRILAHIHDDNIRALAHPGMVLRTVTPEIILYVLGTVSDIKVANIDEAQRLFDKLKREQSLVEVGYRGDLVYRNEIRNAMLRLMMQDMTKVLKKIRKAAIKYYLFKPDENSRAEEMYHRLALGEDDFQTLDERWMPGIETSVAANLEEYTARIKVWLASRISIEIPREVLRNADTSDWERNITRKVKQAMAEKQNDRALALLGERSDRTDNSPLFALEAKTQILLQHYPEAVQVIETGIERISQSNNRGRLAELVWLRAQVEILQEQYLNADISLQITGEAVEIAANKLPFIQVLCYRLLLRKFYEVQYLETKNSLTQRLSEVLSDYEPEGPHLDFMISLALSLLGEDYPRTFAKYAGFAKHPDMPAPTDMLTSQNLEGLDDYRESWEIEETNSIRAIL